MIKSILVAALLGSSILVSAIECDTTCQTTCVQNNDLSDQCMMHCGCERYLSQMMTFLQSQEAGHQFCSHFCSALTSIPDLCHDNCEQQFGLSA